MKNIDKENILKQFAEEKTCLLCDSPDPKFMNVYIPSEGGKSLGFNVQEGKQIYIGYPICKVCLETSPEGGTIAAEMIILHAFGGDTYDLGLEIQ